MGSGSCPESCPDIARMFSASWSEAARINCPDPARISSSDPALPNCRGSTGTACPTKVGLRVGVWGAASSWPEPALSAGLKPLWVGGLPSLTESLRPGHWLARCLPAQHEQLLRSRSVLLQSALRLLGTLCLLSLQQLLCLLHLMRRRHCNAAAILKVSLRRSCSLIDRVAHALRLLCRARLLC